MRDDVSADTEGMCSYLIDLSDVPLDALDELPETALGESLRRVLAESERQPTAYQQFQAQI